MSNSVSRAPQSPRRPLTRRRILRAALRLVDRQGASALTMRRLADEVGAGAMSLYHHVPDREALLDGLSELMVRTVRLTGVADDFPEALRQFMRGIRTVASAHPEAFRLVGMRPLKTAEALPPIEALLAAGRASGLDDLAVFYAYRAAAAFARGYALTEILGLTLEQSSVTGDHVGDGRTDSPRLPHISRALANPAAFDHDAAFEFGLEAVVAGVTAVARR